MPAPRLSFTSLFALAVMMVFGATTLAYGQPTWSWVSANPNAVYDYAYGHGRFVGAGSRTILTSEEGTVWTIRDPGVLDSFGAVEFDGAQFIAIGDRTILTSPDGITWSHQDAPARLFGLATSGSLHVTILSSATEGGAHRFLTSTDGITWTPRDHNSEVDPQLIRCSHGVFVAAGADGRVLTSSDGTHWSAVTIASPAGATASTRLAASESRFIYAYGGATYTSSDGLAWEKVSTGPVLAADGMLGYAAGNFYANEGSNGRGVFRSTDGTSWSAVTMNAVLALNTMTDGGGRIVASKLDKYVPGFVPPMPHRTYVSTDGLSWTTHDAATYDGVPHQVVYGLGRFFFAGKISHDGLSWAEGGFEPTHATGDRLFRIVSQREDGFVYPTIVPYSWCTTTVDVSADGLNSTRVDVRIPTPRAVAFGSGRYVAVGHDGQISTSIDALAWSPASSGTNHTLRDVLFAFNRFIAVGDAGTVLTSPDGLTWSTEIPGTLSGLDLENLAADKTQVIIAAHTLTSEVPPLNDITLSGVIPVRVYRDPAPAPAGYFSWALTNAKFNIVNDTWLGAFYETEGSYDWHISRLRTSSDGATWTSFEFGTDLQYHSYFAPSIAASDDTALFVAFGGDDSGNVIKGYSPEYYYQVLRYVDGAGSPPVITNSPLASSVPRGETAFFSLGLKGSGPFTYQWLHDGTAISGATQPALRIPLTDDKDSGDYAVTVTNSLGTVTSASAHLTITPAVPLEITEQPVGGTLFDRTTVRLSVKVTGSGPITYQWRRNGTTVSSGKSATYEIYGYDIAKDTQVGTYDVVITAPHSTVTSEAVSVVWGGPSVTLSREGTGTLYTGDTLILKATASGAGPFTYRWSTPSAGEFPGVTGPTLILPSLTAADSAPYWVEVTDANGQSARAVKIFSVETRSSPDHPATTVSAWQDVALRAGIIDTYNYRFQWRHNGQPISGATSANFTIHAFSTADEGDYDVVVTAPDGSTSVRSSLSLMLDGSRLVNLSARGFAGGDEATLIQGFVLRGAPSTSSPDVLIRSVGPSLTTLGVNGVLPDPSLHILAADHALVAENDNWSTAVISARGLAATSDAMTSFGAFPLAAGTRDSALVVHQTGEGVYHTVVSGVGGGTGFVLNEIYGPVSGSQRLVNLSARAQVGAGDNVLIAGFVISGKAPLKVLVRGVGPTLSGLGITHPLANPKLTLFNAQGHEIHNNDSWGQAANAADIRTTATAAGAFALAEGSNDAAILETLEPGVYTALVTSVDGSSGVALVEIYEAP